VRVFCLAVLLLAACGKGAAHTGKLSVVATTGMVADLARVIGGDRIEVIALMGPGVDPHLYRATAGDISRLRNADLILYNGKGLEGKMGDIFVKLARKQPVFAVTEGVTDDRLIEPRELHGHYDPHLWFDVALWADATAEVAGALGEIDPAHKDEYGKRARDYNEQLLDLHEFVKNELSKIPRERRVLITSHDAFRYFGRAYDIEVRGLQGISTVSDVGIKDIQAMADLIVRRGIKAVFVESSVSPRAIEAVQRAATARGHDVRVGGTLYSDAMGDEPPEDTYVGMVRANTRTIVSALK